MYCMYVVYLLDVETVMGPIMVRVMGPEEEDETEGRGRGEVERKMIENIGGRLMRKTQILSDKICVFYFTKVVQPSTASVVNYVTLGGRSCHLRGLNLDSFQVAG